MGLHREVLRFGYIEPGRVFADDDLVAISRMLLHIQNHGTESFQWRYAGEGHWRTMRGYLPVILRESPHLRTDRCFFRRKPLPVERFVLVRPDGEQEVFTRRQDAVARRKVVQERQSDPSQPIRLVYLAEAGEVRDEE
jgi:hypothetical protein